MPRVSVVVAAYNHAAYIEQAVHSALNQTYDDLEVIVVDDGSSDDTADRVAAIEDPRLQLFRLCPNHGACAALNLALQQSRAELVAVLNSDDIWEPHKLERQIGALDSQPDMAAVFSNARFIDQRGRPVAVRAMPPWHTIFRQPNRSQARWLRYFFEHGNALCHPSVVIRRSALEAIGYYDNRLRQLPDYDRWIRLAKYRPFLVLGEDELVQFRVHLDHGNTSSPSPQNVARAVHEQFVVCRSFFDRCAPDLFQEAFGDLFADPMAESPEERACEQALLWLNAPSDLHAIYRFFGVDQLYRLLGRPVERQLLRRRYGITDLTVHELAGELADEGYRATIDAGGWLAPVFGPREIPAPSSSGALARELFTRVREVPVWKWPHRAGHHLRRWRRARL